MEIKNWTSALFTKEGSDPAYLPEIFFLPNGDARRSKSCLLSDITAAGFTGPIDQPPFSSVGQIVTWDSVNSNWVVTTVSSTVDPDFENNEVVQYLSSELRLSTVVTDGKLSPSSKKELWLYQGKIRELLADKAAEGGKISWGETPLRPESLVSLSFAQERAENFINIEPQSRTDYEDYGLIFVPSGVEAELLPSIPADWTKGSGSLPKDLVNRNYFIPENYCISDADFNISGYYYVEESSVYSDRVAATIEQNRLDKAPGA
ncbi:MAG: hypothetical protein CBD94_01630 [Gammaproteobacteria bacterium TMED234]|mgnify:CR=1 FL=1|nr:MAG: hypothetical protein CBD94_01630 [Gammaproteobacteria bacterium TMED234]|tara:strand:+ start:13812 stop:14597 length:786 start_codon:yes stop_codon:yes gene_type:complete